jgi:hypothetical protein
LDRNRIRPGMLNVSKLSRCEHTEHICMIIDTGIIIIDSLSSIIIGMLWIRECPMIGEEFRVQDVVALFYTHKVGRYSCRPITTT